MIRLSEKFVPLEMKCGHVITPIGAITVVWCGASLCIAEFAERQDRVSTALKTWFGSASPRRVEVPQWLGLAFAGYFSGDVTALENVMLTTRGTVFQEQVWRALRLTAPGQIKPYSDLALDLGRPKAARAVGAANALNPLAIVIPCHRLVGRDGKLTGYAGGLERKAWLLNHERRFAARAKA
ncbi:MAG: methylated-DNA--[protein]-cysteine S-methyltransferase [Pseudomonadota bacterium]